MNTPIYTLRCQCGWNFLALNRYEKLCPQCRTSKTNCICCGQPADGDKYCRSCAGEIRTIKNRHVFNRPATMREQERLCDYDCFNCKFSDCIMPAEKEIDTETGELW